MTRISAMTLAQISHEWMWSFPSIHFSGVYFWIRLYRAIGWSMNYAFPQPSSHKGYANYQMLISTWESWPPDTEDLRLAGGQCDSIWDSRTPTFQHKAWVLWMAESFKLIHTSVAYEAIYVQALSAHVWKAPWIWCATGIPFSLFSVGHTPLLPQFSIQKNNGFM